MRIIEAEPSGQRRHQLALDLNANGVGLVVRGAVGHVAAAVGNGTRDAKRPVLAERQIDRSLADERVVIAIGYGAVAGQLAEFGLRRQDIDRARGRVPTIERALGPFQHLDPVEVEERSRCRRMAPDVDAVVVEGDRRIAGHRHREVADTADKQRGRRPNGLDRQGGDERAEPGRLGNARAHQIGPADDVDRDCGALRTFRFALRGHDNVIETRRTLCLRSRADVRGAALAWPRRHGGRLARCDRRLCGPILRRRWCAVGHRRNTSDSRRRH